MRGTLDLRGMSQPPDPQNRQNLIFTLRALLGVNARAEIMAWLLTHESGHPADIARSTGYFSKSIQQILNEMAESGQVASIRIGREKHFSVRRREKWQELLCPATGAKAAIPEWLNWMPLFSVVTHFAETLGKPGLDETSEHSRQQNYAMPSITVLRLSPKLDAHTPCMPPQACAAQRWSTLS